MADLDTLHQIYRLLERLDLDDLEFIREHLDEEIKYRLLPKRDGQHIFDMRSGVIVMNDDFNDPVPDEY